jgi:hypothetical protein
MSLRTHVIALAAVCLPLVLSSAAQAADPQLLLPNFDHLRGAATESVNITLGRSALNLATLALNDENPDNAAAREVLRGIKAVNIRSYEFAADNGYSKADIEAVRSQLSAPGWSPLAQLHKHHADVEDIDVYVSMDDDKVNGLAVVASTGRKFTIVNIVGTIDPAKLAALDDRFGLSSLSL